MLLKDVQVEREKHHAVAVREFRLNFYLFLLLAVESIAFFFLIPRFIANVYSHIPNFSVSGLLTLVIMIPVVGIVAFFSVLNALRCAFRKAVRIWQIEVVIGSSFFVGIFGLGEVYYLAFPSVLNLGYFWNGFGYNFLFPCYTIGAALTLITRRSSRYNRWHDEHFEGRRWNETYYKR